MTWLGTVLTVSVAACIAWAGPAAAQDAQALLVSTPPGFKLAWNHAPPDGSVKMTEFVPEGQTVETWRQMVTVQHFPRLAGADPNPLLGSWTQRLTSVCPKAQVSRVPQPPVNGHAAARVYVHVTDCGTRPAESILAVMISGRDALHMIQHAWRPQPPTREQLEASMRDLDRARLCASSDRACAK